MGGRVVAVMLSAAGCEFIGLFRGGRSKVAPPYNLHTAQCSRGSQALDEMLD